MRYLNVNLLWVVPATAAIAAFWLVSAKANYEFGLSLGDPIFGYASLASDVTKTVALFGVFAAWASRYYVASAVLAFIWAACTLWSVASAVGFMSLHYATMTDQRGKSAEDYKLITGQLARFEEQLSKVGSARPEAVVQAEIAGLLRTPGANGCSTINGPVTQLICPKVDKLRAELGSSQSFAWLTGRIEEMRRELKTSDRVTSVDPRAETLAALVGISVKNTKKGMVAFFALLLELVTAMGFWAFWRAFAGRSETPQQAPEAVLATATAITVVAPPAPAPRAEMRPISPALAKLAGVAEPNLPEVPVSSDVSTPRPIQGNVSEAKTGADVTTPPDGPGTPVAKPEEPATEETEDAKIVRPAQWHDESVPPVAPRTNGKRSKRNLTRKDQIVIQWLADSCSITGDERDATTGAACHASYKQYCDGRRIPEKDRVAQARMSTILSGHLDTRVNGRGKRKNQGAVFTGLMINPTVAQRRKVAA